MAMILMVKRLQVFFASLFRSKQKRVYSSPGAGSNGTGSQEAYNIFQQEHHFQPLFDKTKFDALHGWEFGWAVLEPINSATSKEDEKLLATRLSPGQKALYFIWYLDAEVTNGGFIQFYWNGKGKYLPPIIDGLELIGDSEMLNLVNKADQEFKTHMDDFLLQKQKDDWEPLYENLKNFDAFDDVYYATHDRMMGLIEKYARQNPEEFVRFE